MAAKSFIYRFDGVEVREREFLLVKAGEERTVEPKAFRALLFLLRNPQKVISKEELLNAVWGDVAVTEGSLTRCIWLLRRLLEDDTNEPRYIATVATIGYRFIAKVEVSEDGSEASAVESVAAAVNPSTVADGINETVRTAGKPAGWAREARWRRLVPAIAVVAVIVGLLGWYLSRPLPQLRVTGYTRITRDAVAKAPIGSDGTRLYFTVYDPPSIGQVALSGGETAPVSLNVPGIAHPLLADLSPDGSSFLVVPEYRAKSSDLPLWNVRIFGDSARHLANALDAAYSPDGKSVAYSTFESEIWVISIDGTGARKLASLGGDYAYRLAWSPNGAVIRFTRGQLTSEQASLWEVSTDGSNLHQFLASWNGAMRKCCGRWTPDGRFFLFRVTPPGFLEPRSEIWALDERRGFLRRTSSEPFQLTSGPIRWDWPVPGKDEKTILAQGVILRGELSRLDTSAGLFRPFLKGISAQGVIFSKDGKSVTYVSYPEGTLWKANSDGSNPVQLTDPPLEAFLPRWSPDGKQIVFTGFSSAGDGNDYVIPAEGGNPRKLLPDDKGFQLHADWSPDGRRIVFNSVSSSETPKFVIRIIDLESHQVTTVPGSGGLWGPRWSPDGRYLAAGESYDERKLRIFDFKTQQWSTLPQNGVVASPVWSRDSQFIYFRRPLDDRGVFRIRVSGGAAEKIADLKDWHDAGWWGRWMELDPMDAPLLLRDIGSADVYSLALEEK
jgi:Tol biopolymer transport system component/DNA-binding winged helix-turn-helix (wHTH) protein